MSSHTFTIHIAPDGKDANGGTESAPLATLTAARDLARTQAGQAPVEIIVANGIYYLPETLVLSPQDSGTAEAPVVYRAENEGQAILSGGLLLDLEWEPAPEVAEGVFKTTTPAGLVIDQVFINGERQHMARYPNFDPEAKTVAYQGHSADAFSKERAARWANPAGGYIHAMNRQRWGGYHYRIMGKDSEGNVTYEGGWQNNRQMGMHADQRMVENIFEELDAPGEWFHNRESNTLFYFPPPGLDLSAATVEVVRLRHLVEMQGTEDDPVRHISLSGFTFRHTTRTFMETKEPLLRSDWTIYRGGAVLLTGTEDVSILDSTFDQVGGNAIFVSNYNRRVLVKGCHIFDTGASGICFVGSPNAVRDLPFEYGESQDLSQIDRTPGPKTNEYPADSTVEDCLIHGIGRVERQPAGVQISMARRITVRDCSIYDCARAGINVSEGTWGGHLIEGVDVFDTVLETHDHGSFNSWGRDRFWHRNHRQVTEPAVKEDPTLPFLDAVETTIIRNSRWRCDHGWDIDLDDGSSNYEITNNLMLRGGLKLREGYNRIATNNILINNGLHPHVWFEASGDQFTRNIVFAPPAHIRNAEDWPAAVDRNFFTSEQALERSQRLGADGNSIAGNPKFLDAAAGDFRVADDSPALEIGFENFPMDQFGVKKPSLRAIARTPEIPELARDTRRMIQDQEKRELEAANWLGLELQGLQGEEYSAFGVSAEDGGVHIVQISRRSPLASAGFQVGDLIQKINGKPVRTPAELIAEAAKPDGEITVQLVRNQQPMELSVPASR